MIESLKKMAKVKFKPDIVIFEGWCVGVTPQKKDLIKPLNVLEKENDKKIWRKYVNKELKGYYKNI